MKSSFYSWVSEALWLCLIDYFVHARFRDSQMKCVSVHCFILGTHSLNIWMVEHTCLESTLVIFAHCPLELDEYHTDDGCSALVSPHCVSKAETTRHICPWLHDSHLLVFYILKLDNATCSWFHLHIPYSHYLDACRHFKVSLALFICKQGVNSLSLIVFTMAVLFFFMPILTSTARALASPLVR